MPGYHYPPQAQDPFPPQAQDPFPPQAQDPGYGYNNQPLLAPQQWGQQGAAQAYELNYQAYSTADPGPFRQTAHHPQEYAEPEQDYNDEFFEDEEPRRGRRWVLIVVALVGAIGVGGALAYTYRSLIAPHVGRVPLVKADPNVKVKPEIRGGKDFAGADRKSPVRVPDEAAPKSPESAAPQDPSSENPGPRVVKSIPITPGGVAAPSPQASTAPSVPGITLYQPPQAQQPAAAPPPVQPAPAVAPKVVPAPPPPGRVVVGAAPGATDDDPSQAAAPPAKRAPAQSPVVAAARPAPTKPSPASGGLGYVAVLSSQKSYLKALEIFADLRDKYGNVLDNKTPDVQEADLSARGLGTMYRLVVGPPGSHNAASGVCAQLRTAGYEGCWVKEY